MDAGRRSSVRSSQSIVVCQRACGCWVSTSASCATARGLWTSGLGIEELSSIFHVEKEEKESWNDHLSVKPVRLLEQLVLTFSMRGQVVLDPFLGRREHRCSGRGDGTELHRDREGSGILRDRAEADSHREGEIIVFGAGRLGARG